MAYATRADWERQAVDAAVEAARREAGKAIADRIIAELVCCHVYEEHAEAGSYNESVHGHAICYWGEAGARIAQAYAEAPWPADPS